MSNVMQACRAEDNESKPASIVLNQRGGLGSVQASAEMHLKVGVEKPDDLTNAKILAKIVAVSGKTQTTTWVDAKQKTVLDT